MSWVAIAIGMGIGATAGGITSAINKQPVWKGMLIGAGTGAAGGALGAGLGSLGGAAAGTAGGTTGGTTGGAVGSAAAPVASTAAPVASTAAPVTSSVATPITSTAASTATPVASTTATAPVTSSMATPVASTAAPVAATPAATSAAPTGFIDTIQQMGVSGVGKEAAKMAAPEILKGGIGMFSAPSYDNSSDKDYEQSLLNAVETANEVYKPLGSTGGWGYQGMARGGEIRYANKKGGSLRLTSGSFIIPADVVSAIGNGSTKAGARYLDHLFNALSAGPPPKAGSLAKRKALERRNDSKRRKI